MYSGMILKSAGFANSGLEAIGGKGPMKNKKFRVIVATALLGIGMMVDVYAVGMSNNNPGWYGGPGTGTGYHRYMSEEDIRRAMREEREAVSARHQWREADRARRDGFWRNSPRMRGWSGNNRGYPPGWYGAPGARTGYRR